MRRKFLLTKTIAVKIKAKTFGPNDVSKTEVVINPIRVQKCDLIN